jgi:hypothetical protein
MEARFKILRFVGMLWKIIAWIVLVGGVLSSLALLIMSIVGGAGIREVFETVVEGMVGEIPPWVDWIGGVFLFLMSLVGSLLNFLVFYAAGELIHLFLAIEENTRLAYEQLQWVQTGTAPTFAGPAPPAELVQ